jgi:hypothetical protein
MGNCAVMVKMHVFNLPERFVKMEAAMEFSLVLMHWLRKE